MKKMMRKFAAFFVGILLVGSLSGCSTFDASAYVQAVLDNVYFNDSAGIVELGIGTEAEAAAIYDEGIETLVDVVLSSVTVSEELREEYRRFYKDLYSSVKYTVGEVTEIDDKTFEVTITCERLNVFADAIAAYEVKVGEMVAVWTEAALAGEEVPSDEEMNEQLFTAFKDCLTAELGDAVYDAPATVTVRVESVDNVWAPDQEDILNLEYALVDFEELFLAE